MESIAMTAPLISSFAPDGQREALPRAVSFLKVLGHEGRLEILCHLIDGEHGVSELVAATGASQPAVSQQLMRLRAEGLVRTERRGKSVLYSIARPEIAKVVSALRDAFCPVPGQAIWPDPSLEPSHKP
jgi:ArsR family transcriptional regulator